MRMNVFIVMLVLAAFDLPAQDIATSANGLKTEKQLKKERKDAERNMEYITTGHFLDSMQFVLQAEYLSNSRGMRSIVTSSLNYILVDSLKGSIQTGTNFGIGRNGIGGSTARGNITNWKLTKNEKRKSFMIRIDFSTDLGFYTVFMDVSADRTASARLSGIGGGSLTFDGNLVPLRRSRIYQARSGY